MVKTRASQFETMIEFMERHGDLQNPTQDRLGNLKRWHELADLLNDHTKGEPKPLEKWRKAWSDFKNNTKRKAERLRQHGGEGPILTALEMRVLQLIGLKRKNRDVSQLDENDTHFKVEADSDPCRGSLTPPQRYFASVDDHATRRRRKSSSASSSSASSSEPTVKKTKQPEVSPDGVKDITDRFFEYEREKEKMAHEQEMTRMKQNEELLKILGRMVNVLENLAPSIQKYLDRNTNGDG